MIKIYEGEHKIDIEDHSDIENVLEVMEKLDEVYKHRSEIVSDLITIHKDILFYSICYVLEKPNDDSIHIIKEGIKYWSVFTQEQQENILIKLLKEEDNSKLVDTEIKNWLEVIEPKD